MIESKLLQDQYFGAIFEHKCSCGHIFYEIDSKIPRTCPGCGFPNPDAIGLPSKDGFPSKGD